MGIFRRDDSPPNGISQRTTPEGFVTLDPLDRSLEFSATGSLLDPASALTASPTLQPTIQTATLTVTP